MTESFNYLLRRKTAFSDPEFEPDTKESPTVSLVNFNFQDLTPLTI